MNNAVAKQMYDALRAIEEAGYRLDVTRVDHQVIMFEARNAMDAYEGHEPNSLEAVLYVAFSETVNKYVSVMATDKINWTDDIDCAMVFTGAAAIQTALNTVNHRVGVEHQVKYV